MGGGFPGSIIQRIRFLRKLYPNGGVYGLDAGLNGTVSDIGIQEDGKVVIVGSFSEVGGVARRGIARLNMDGSLDGSFVPPAIRGTFTGVLIQRNGQILVGGRITEVDWKPFGSPVRLNADGSLDASWSPKIWGGLNTDYLVPALGNAELAHYKAGRLWIRGDFSMIDDVPVSGIAVLFTGEVVKTFDGWAETLPEDQRGRQDDPGGHGVPNLIRYAFNMEPHAPTRENLPALGRRVDAEEDGAETYVVLEYVRRKDADDITWALEGSEDLVEWLPISGRLDVEDAPDGGERVVAWDNVPVSETRQRFIRLRVQ